MLDTVLATDSVEKLVVVTRPDSVAEVEKVVARAHEQVRVVVRGQARPAGTLDAVRTAAPDIEHAVFSVHYGDNLFGWRCLPPLGVALAGDATACLYTVQATEDWRRYAAVSAVPMNGRGMIATGLEEKPSWDHPPAVLHSLTGFFRFDAAAFLREAPRVPMSPRGEFELTDVVRRLLTSGRVRVIQVELPWIDFGTEPAFHEAPTVIEARGLTRA